MIKRILFLVGILISLLSFNVFAQEYVTAYITSAGQLNVNIISDIDTDTHYTIYVVDDGTVIPADLTSGTLTGIKKIEQATIVVNPAKDYNNEALNKNVTSLTADTKYDIIIGGGSLNGLKIDAVYASAATLNPKLALLKAADKTTVGSVLSTHNGVAWAVNTSNSDYVANKAKADENLVSILKGSNDVNQSFTNAVELAKLVSCEKSNIFDLLLRNESNFGIVYDTAVTSKNSAFLDAFDNLRKDTVNNPITNVTQLQTVLGVAKAIGEVNEATRDTIITKLQTYNHIFLLNFTGDYTRVSEYNMKQKMVANTNPYTSILDVQQRFSNAINSLLITPPTLGGSTTSSNGSSGSIPSGVITPPIVESVNPVLVFTDINDAEWAKPYITYMKDKGILSGYGDGTVRPNDGVKREEYLKMLLEALKLSAGEEIELNFVDVDENEWYVNYVKDGYILEIIKGMSDSVFGIGEYVTRQDAAVMLARAVDAKKVVLNQNTSPITFTDESDIEEYAKAAVTALQTADIISGYENGEYRPLSYVTRAEAAKLIYSVLKNLGML